MGSEAAPAPAQPQAWNPFKSQAKLPLPPEPMPSGEEELKQVEKGAPRRQPTAIVPSDHEILTSLPPDKIWENMQQHASEGCQSLASLFYQCNVFMPVARLVWTSCFLQLREHSCASAFLFCWMRRRHNSLMT